MISQNFSENQIKNINYDQIPREEITESQTESMDLRELNRLYLLYSYNLDPTEDNIHFTPKNRLYLDKNVMIITMEPQETSEEILNHLHEDKINNLQFSNKENRNNLAGIHCNISLHNDYGSTTII